MQPEGGSWATTSLLLAKLDDFWLSYHKYNKGESFSEKQCMYVEE